MTLFKRRMIYLFFILLFVAIAPMLILFANGYRFDWGTWNIYKTGLLVMEYLPRDATFTIDGVLQSTHAPERVNGLTPRSYSLRIEKEGYLPWMKRLWIPEYVTTFLRHVILFKQSTPHIAQGTYLLPTQHPSQLLIAAGQKTPSGIAIVLLSPTNSKPLTALAPLTTLEQLSWSPNGRRLLIVGTQGDRRIVSLVAVSDTDTVIALDRTFTLPLSHVQWDMHNDDVIVGYSRERRGTWLTTVNIRARTFDQTRVPDEAFDRPFVLDGNRLVLQLPPEGIERASDDKGTPILFRSFSTEKSSVEYRFRLPSAYHDLRMITEQSNVLTFIDDQEKKTIYVVEREPRVQEPIVETFANITNARWSPNGRRLAYWNDAELFLWDLERNTKERIHRTATTPVINIIWHPENEYLFLQTKKTIEVLEIDGRDERNLVTLVSSLEDIGSAGVDAEGQWLWTNSAEGIKWYEIK